MKRVFLGLAWIIVSVSLTASASFGFEDVSEGRLAPKAMRRELASRAARLGTSAGTSDTTWVGYTPGHFNAATNYWSIYAGFGKDGFARPVNGQPSKGLWNWDEPVNGDSLQGWWPYRGNSIESLAGDTDRSRPHTCFDSGNQANYVINQDRSAGPNSPGYRTIGVDGVWHVDGGSTISVAGVPAPSWAPLVGTGSAWMGLRAHGDNSHADPLTRNPFNEDVMIFNQTNATRSSGTDKRFPGYGSQMDQILYRDVDLLGKADTSLTLSFRYRTNMSTTALSVSRFGWFNHDPLGVPSTSNQLNNFISGADAGAANAPADSFMVYVGAGVEGDQWLGSDGALHDLYDLQHRWFAEVLHCDKDPASPAANPRPRYYRQLLSVAGDKATSQVTYTIPSGLLQQFLERSPRIRVAFRVKTNIFFDDERTGGRTYSSNGAGAAVVDDVRIRVGAHPETVLGDFETPGRIDNDTTVSALTAWKSTGKPPAIYSHVEQLDQLLYQDICGQKGDPGRVCDMSHGVLSMGDHDNGEASGGDIVGRSDRDRRHGFVSPTIQLVDDDGNPNTRNAQGLYGIGGNGGVGDVSASEDFYVRYDLYSGIYDGNTGNFWRPFVMSYPCRVTDATPVYAAWGQIKLPGGIFFQPVGRLCSTEIQGARQYGLIRSSNANGIPDSLKIGIQTIQLCYAFAVPTGCSPRDGAYFDNLALAIVDGTSAEVSVDIWQWIQDAFPANESPGFPGNAALFDTTAALVKTGLNISQDTNDEFRYTVAGDSVTIQSTSNTARMDMVFRVLPGPGNYQPIGDGHNGAIRKVPSNPAVVTSGDGSWWDVYRTNPGEFASPNAAALMQNAKGGWDPNVWLSARCDTADFNLYALQNRGITGGPQNAQTWMATYHESDKRYSVLGITKNRCFVLDAAGLLSNIRCEGSVPAYLPAGTQATTKEFTKIIPDGLLTPGSHVEYFFRSQHTEAPGAAVALCPDTNVVFPQMTEGPNYDGHRWQEFSILPDRWKDPAYLHPVFQTFGRGPACLLVVDWNDRRGDELAWVSIADTIGATHPAKFGAHNGWHSAGNVDVNDPAARVAAHGGSPGTTWDLYQVKASESIDTGSGTLGSRLAYRGGSPLVADKSARNAPTPEMLDAYYTLMLVLTGDLNSNIFGPFLNKTDDDVGILAGWLEAGNSSFQDRGIWAMGNGFVEANTLNATELSQLQLMSNYFRVDLVNRSFPQFANVSDPVVDLRVFPGWQGKDVAALYGVRNHCTQTNDVIRPSTPLLTSPASQYEMKGAPIDGYFSGVFKDWDPSSPWKALVDGYDILSLASRNGTNTVGRSSYFYKVFTNVWAKIWTVAGAPIVPLDVPGLEGEDFTNFMRLTNNPVMNGQASIHFGIARTDRVEARIFDVSGRRVRVIADREFAVGEHDLVWDGFDQAGRRAPRGVYFVELRTRGNDFEAHRKLTLLR